MSKETSHLFGALQQSSAAYSHGKIFDMLDVAVKIAPEADQINAPPVIRTRLYVPIVGRNFKVDSGLSSVNTFLRKGLSHVPGYFGYIEWRIHELLIQPCAHPALDWRRGQSGSTNG
jgi:hypothetical protein